MSETIKIDLQENAPHRVALELAYKIAHNESTEKDRNYWLKLFYDCRQVVVSGNVPPKKVT